MIKPDYNNNLINISNSLLKHYGCYPFYKTLPILDNYLKKEYKHVILILLDGLGKVVIDAHLEEGDLLKKNLKTTLDSVFPPTTVAATNALLSAKPPFVSGFIGWSQYNPFDKVTEVIFLNEDYYNPKNKLKTNLRKEFLNYKSILDLIKEKNPKLEVELLMPKFDPINGHESFADQLNRLLMITKGRPSFSYAYWTEPDATLHDYGIYQKETQKVVKGLNKSYERFLKEIADDVLVIVTADHGFMDVEEINLFEYKDITSTFKKNPSIEPRALTFFIKEDEKEKFKELFKKNFSQWFILMTKEELLKSELLGYGKAHPLLDTFIGDFMAISTSNKMFSLIKDSYFKGHHAGLTKQELEIPLIINQP